MRHYFVIESVRILGKSQEFKLRTQTELRRLYINPGILTLKNHTNTNPCSAYSRSKLWNFFMTPVYILHFICKLYVIEHDKPFKMSTRSPKNIN